MANAGSIADPPLERLARPRSVTEMFITQIRELIVTGRLVLGERLSENALAEQLGLMRSRRRIAGSQRGRREIVNALKSGRDADAAKKLGKHVYNFCEAFRREIEAARASRSADMPEVEARGAAR